MLGKNFDTYPIAILYVSTRLKAHSLLEYPHCTVLNSILHVDPLAKMAEFSRPKNAFGARAAIIQR